MFQSTPNALPLTRRVLQVLIVLNILSGILILVILLASLGAELITMNALGARSAPGNAARIMGMRLIMAIGLASVPLIHAVLTRLRAMVDTVRAGDPFVAENAARLAWIAWAVLGLELLSLAVGGVAAAASSPTAPLDVGGGFSLTPWVAVLLLFVLARVFEHGTRMREELEGTV
ncbi:MAG TPA: DUF2975 domain-containing protein [Longimicrobiaceae bacterium]|nr:DUF2975 domain-containing protein [Longimicrobiaceae bacterium]